MASRFYETLEKLTWAENQFQDAVLESKTIYPGLKEKADLK